MKHIRAMLAIAIVGFGAVAGCTNSGTTPTPSGTTPPATPTPTASPTVPATSVTEPSIRAVYVVSLTDSVGPGADAEVCWRVEGNGAIGHTAVHFDAASHPNATSFTEYAGGTVYPNNSAPASSATFALPGTFCGEIRGVRATTYLRAHALAAGVPPSEALSAEKVVPLDGSRNITFSTGFREIAPPSGASRVCWLVTGLTGTTTHTAIHFDNVSHPGGTFADYAGGAVYPNNAAPTAVNVSLPGEFCANVTMPARGTLHMVAHVIHNGDHHHSEERNVVAVSRMSATGGLPALAVGGRVVNICWRAEGFGSTQHTAIHWDTRSHPNATAFGEYAGGAYYPDNAAPTDGPWTLPGPFCAGVTMPASGALYFRPHAIFDGAFHDLGPEYVIRVA